MRPRSEALARLARIPDTVVLASLAVVATAARFAAGIPHTSPRYFPDEYIYPALARSILHGHLEIRGEPAHFPAMLEPFVQAPLWLVHGIDLPFRLVQLQHAAIASLAIVPVYLLARRLGLPRWQQLGCAVVVLTLPSWLFSEYLTADALGAALALGALASAAAVLERRTVRSQCVFLALALLAAGARVQYIILLPAFAVAALAGCGFRPLRTVRAYPLLSSLLAIGAIGGFAVGASRMLGYYDGLLAFDVTPGAMVHWTGSDCS